MVFFISIYVLDIKKKVPFVVLIHPLGTTIFRLLPKNRLLRQCILCFLNSLHVFFISIYVLERKKIMFHLFFGKTTCEIVFVTGVTGKPLFCVANKNLISFSLANCLYLFFFIFHLCLFSCLFPFGQGENEEETPLISTHSVMICLFLIKVVMGWCKIGGLKGT